MQLRRSWSVLVATKSAMTNGQSVIGDGLKERTIPAADGRRRKQGAVGGESSPVGALCWSPRPSVRSSITTGRQLTAADHWDQSASQSAKSHLVSGHRTREEDCPPRIRRWWRWQHRSFVRFYLDRRSLEGATLRKTSCRIMIRTYRSVSGPSVRSPVITAAA